MRLTARLDQIHTTRTALIVIGGLVIWWLAYSIIQPFADWLTFTLLGLSRDSHIGASLNFFAYDVPKILLLLAGMIFLITLLQTFIDVARVRTVVEKRGEGVGNLMASVSGHSPHFAHAHRCHYSSDLCKRASHWALHSHF